MKKFRLFLLSALLVVSMAGAVMAQTIACDPVAGPCFEAQAVFNNSGNTLDVGDVVVWDIGSSTGDNDNYVTTTTTATTGLVAGVVYPVAIATASAGSIVTYGQVTVDATTDGTAPVAGGYICTSGTAGAARTCGINQNAFGHATGNASAGSATAFINP